MSYTKVLPTDQLAPGNFRKLSLSDQTILLFNIDGSFYAINEKCTHMGGSLAEGRLEGNIIRCPRHGAGFDVRTGKCVINPKILFLKQTAHDITTYPVKVEDNTIFIDVE